MTLSFVDILPIPTPWNTKYTSIWAVISWILSQIIFWNLLCLILLGGVMEK
ncbi:MAG: hypothetical protein FJ041_06760 [Candidatus Cloacimonetes bacterium]|nr:hypothetical protein [Candidatus Cloacimonadota bacterium]